MATGMEWAIKAFLSHVSPELQAQLANGVQIMANLQAQLDRMEMKQDAILDFVKGKDGVYALHPDGIGKPAIGANHDGTGTDITTAGDNGTARPSGSFNGSGAGENGA